MCTKEIVDVSMREDVASRLSWRWNILLPHPKSFDQYSNQGSQRSSRVVGCRWGEWWHLPCVGSRSATRDSMHRSFEELGCYLESLPLCMQSYVRIGAFWSSKIRYYCQFIHSLARNLYVLHAHDVSVGGGTFPIGDHITRFLKIWQRYE